MMRHEQWFELKPRIKARPRMTSSGRAYTPKATKDFEAALLAEYTGPVFNGPVSMTVELQPDRFLVVLEDSPITRQVGLGRGDLDNFAKALGDGLQGEGGAFADDKQVHELSIRFGDPS